MKAHNVNVKELIVTFKMSIRCDQNAEIPAPGSFNSIKPNTTKDRTWFPPSIRIPVTPDNKEVLKELRAAEDAAWQAC